MAGADPVATTRFDGTGGPRIIGPDDGRYADLGSVGVRFMIWTAESGGDFSLVEHPIPPRTLVAPLHRHSREDEYSFIIEGRMGAKLGDDVVEAGPGDLVFKPRNQWHTFWNAGDERCRILEIIAPGGFEQFFADADNLIASMDVASMDPKQVMAAEAELGGRYGLEFDFESVPALCAEHGLTFPT